ncbi:MAG: MotA/TolQ/ExbB proton channel family protein [Verrucomicrobiota bacterium]|nr:MotA/TolQ/ExbB proton channel family protein [Verrucomicrobiota bacterium]
MILNLFNTGYIFLAEASAAATTKASAMAASASDNSMGNIWEGAGFYKWPLALCSILAVFIIIERVIALRSSRVIPPDLEEAFVSGEFPTRVSNESVAGRILNFYNHRNPDGEQLKAFARLQITRMERGLFILDTVVSAGPLLGLLGTVTGLVKVFGGISAETGLPNPEVFVAGVAMALTTTVMGLFVAIPALVFSNYLNRRIDTQAAKLNVGVQRLITLRDKTAVESELIS